MAKLVLSKGGSVLYQCFLDKDRISVGRGGHNHVVVDDPAVSRRARRISCRSATITFSKTCEPAALRSSTAGGWIAISCSMATWSSSAAFTCAI